MLPLRGSPHNTNDEKKRQSLMTSPVLTDHETEKRAEVSPVEVNFKELFHLPDGFPYDRIKLQRCLTEESGRSTFEAVNAQTGEKVFVRFTFNPLDIPNQYLDFRHSHAASEREIVPALELFDAFSPCLKERFPQISEETVRSLQFGDFEAYMEECTDHYALKPGRIWVALTKKWVDGAVPLQQYMHTHLEEAQEWLAQALDGLVVTLSLRGLLVRDLISRPNGSLSGNVLIVPSEKQACISDIEYAEERSYTECRQIYPFLLEDFLSLMRGEKLITIGSGQRQYSMLVDPAEADELQEMLHQHSSVMIFPGRQRIPLLNPSRCSSL